MAKMTVERCCVLDTGDIKDVLRLGVGGYAAPSWRVAAHPDPFVLHILGLPYRGGLALAFLCRTWTGEIWRYLVEIDYSPTPYGDRPWFKCPWSNCGRICSKLYAPSAVGLFGCRTCWNLSYESRQDRYAKFFRSMRAITKLRLEQAKPSTSHYRWIQLEREYLRLKVIIGEPDTWPRAR